MTVDVRFSNRPVWVKRFQTSTTPVSMSLAGSRFSPESALRPFHHGVRERGGTIYWSALLANRQQVQADIRSHLIHRPARDIIPPCGGARVFPIGFDGALSCCCSLLPAPAKLGAVNPDAMQDHSQPARQCHDCLLHATAPGDLHRPGLEPGPPC
jgi:hypothetical protein